MIVASAMVATMTGSALAVTSSDAPRRRSVDRPTFARVDEPTGSVRLYRHRRPWSDRDLATLESLGLVLDDDVIVQPMRALIDGVPAGTELVILSSNAAGTPRAAGLESSAGAQASLARFLRGGGVLIAGLGDNLEDGGYVVPRGVGTPDLIFPRANRCADASLTQQARGDDDLRGTDDDHFLVVGPDGVPGTGDDLTDRNIDMRRSCYVAHGTLVDGITLPRRTTWLETAAFRQLGERPITGEYCVGRGRVIATTVTMEFEGHRPFGSGPSIFLRNLYSYALGPHGPCHGP
jgi:hypothetical protein